MMKRDFATDQIGAMRKQEESESYKCRDYLADVSADAMMIDDGGADCRGPVDENCRRKMCIWCCQVVDFFKFNTRETVFMASSYLDRFLSSSDESAETALFNRKEYQLFSMTSLYLAIKVHETIEVDVSIMVKLSRGDYRVEDFVRAEADLIRALAWRLNGPTPTEFVRRFVSLLPPDAAKRPGSTSNFDQARQDQHDDIDGNDDDDDSNISSSSHHRVTNEYMLMDFARFQTEISVTDYTFVATRPSLIATASVLNAVDTIENLSLTAQQKQDFVQAIQKAVDINLQSPEVACVREQLRMRFNKSRGYSTISTSDARSVYTYSSEHDAPVRNNSSRPGTGKAYNETRISSRDASPVCVRVVGRR